MSGDRRRAENPIESIAYRLMCERGPCATDLADDIDHDYTYVGRQRYLNRLDGSEFSHGCAERLAETLVSQLDLKNAFYRKEAWSALQTLAEAYPEIVSKQVPDVLSLGATADVDVDEEVGEILSAIVDRGKRVPEITDREIVESLQEADPKICRRVAIELYRRRGEKSDLQALHDITEYETRSLAELSERALGELVAEALRALVPTEESMVSTEAAVSKLRYVTYNATDQLTSHSDRLFELLRTENADVAIVALAEIVSGDGATEEIVERLGEYVRIDLVEATGRDLEEQGVYRRAENALETLIEANRSETVSSYIVSRATEWLESESVERTEHALTQLRVLAERDPAAIEDQVQAVSEMASGDGTEGSLAGAVLRRYGQSRSRDTISYIEEVSKTLDGGSVVAHLANAVDCLQYRHPGETQYRSIDVDPATEKALSNIATAVMEGRTMPAIWPEYEPRVVVLVALELALRGNSYGTDIVVFSPGGQHHWGNKGDLRSEYANYGVTISDETTTIPLPNIVPHARIDDGTIKPMSEASADSRVVFSKRVEEIRSLDTLQTLVPNLTSRTKETYEAALDDLVDTHDQLSIVPIYTNFTKHEFDERRAPRYGPPKDLEGVDTLPGVEALEAATETNPERSASRFPGDFDSWFDQATEPQRVRIVNVADEGLLKYLEPGYEASAELREYDENRAAGRIFSRQLMFERLPFPANRYDEWVRNQREGYFGPRTIDALLDKLEERAEDVIGRPAVAAYLFDTVDALRRAREHLADRNPMYEELCEQLQNALEDDETVAVFLPKRTWCRAFETIAVEDGVVDSDAVEADRVRFVYPDLCRDLDSFDKLFVVGPQRPQYAGFYVSPAVGETVVFTYDGNWEWMISRDAKRFVSQKNAAADGVDYTPYAEPVITVPTDPNGVETVEPIPPEEATAATPSADETHTARPIAESTDRRELTELFNHSRTVDYGSGGSSRYDDYERKEYEILTESGERFTRRETVMRRRTSVSPNQDRYHWLSPRSLREGDEIAIFDEGAFERRWDEWLTETYRDEHGETTVFRDLKTWYDTLEEIVTELAERQEVTDLTHGSVRKVVERKTSNIDRRPSTVWRWFESVIVADDALGLARDPTLTIGPRRASDIDALGEAFGHDELTGKNALQIEENMSRIRMTNMKQGHQFRNHLAEEMNSLECSGLEAETTIYTIESVREL